MCAARSARCSRSARCPVVNENDATATDEISFGDNDALAAQVAVLVRARLLVLLTSVPGVLREGVLIDDGAAARDGRVRPRQRARTRRDGEQGRRRGGRGRRRHPDVIAAATATACSTGCSPGSATGTRFAAAESAPAFKLWLRHGKRVPARITSTQARARGCRRAGASLLAVGVTGWDADVPRGRRRRARRPRRRRLCARHRVRGRGRHRARCRSGASRPPRPALADGVLRACG